jgi:catechol 2,3-dioxygenase-like lactoylglutathione lyase family enzyme
MPNNKKQEHEQGYATSPGMKPADQSGNFGGEGGAQEHLAGGQTSGQGQEQQSAAGTQSMGQGQAGGSSGIGTGYGKETGQGQGAAAQRQKTDVDNLGIDNDETNQGNRSDSPESNKEWSPGSPQADS